MTEGILKTILECLKLTPRYLIAIGLVAGLILFGSDDFRKILGLTKFAEDNRFILGILFLSSIALLLVAIAGDGWNKVQRWWWERKAFKRITERLDRLTEDEKQILRYYVAKNTRSNCLSIEDGVVNGLVADGVIFRSASVGNMIDGFAHNISNIAWNYLHVNPDRLNGTTNTYRTDKRTGMW